jgi:enamine deaminase RidA (YjgF/YER057c/UK114 family)
VAPNPSSNRYASEFEATAIRPGGLRDVLIQDVADALDIHPMETALAAGGAGLQRVVKWNVYILHGQSAQAGFEAFQKVWGQRPNPPVIKGIFVPALAHPDSLVETDAIAVVPQK